VSRTSYDFISKMSKHYQLTRQRLNGKEYLRYFPLLAGGGTGRVDEEGILDDEKGLDEEGNPTSRALKNRTCLLIVLFGQPSDTLEPSHFAFSLFLLYIEGK
jgi:hypothetical protein